MSDGAQANEQPNPKEGPSTTIVTTQGAELAPSANAASVENGYTRVHQILKREFGEPKWDNNDKTRMSRILSAGIRNVFRAYGNALASSYQIRGTMVSKDSASGPRIYILGTGKFAPLLMAISDQPDAFFKGCENEINDIRNRKMFPAEIKISPEVQSEIIDAINVAIAENPPSKKAMEAKNSRRPG